MARGRKAPCIDVELDARSDLRFGALGSIAGYNAYESLGRMVHLWAWCTERAIARRDAGQPWQPPIAPDPVVRLFLGPLGVQAILGEGVDELALGSRVDEPPPGGIYIRGTHRTVWCDELAATASAGGTSRAATAERTSGGRFAPANHQPAGEKPPAAPASSTSTSSSTSSSSTEEEKARTKAWSPGQVADAGWMRFAALQSKLMSELGVTGVRPLHPQDAGSRELLARIREAGEARAQTDLDHVLAVLEREARSKTATPLKRLNGAAFQERAWRWALSQDLNASAETSPRAKGGTGTVFDGVEDYRRERRAAREKGATS